VNCGAIPPSLLEGELFGFEKGAFTGADRAHRGLFERADGGSLFLDEIGDMPPELQVKLLRVLQERRFTRLGGEEERSSDFRLLSASNRDLGQLVREGAFREDLFYRVNVITLRLPPLRDRREDIPLLVEHLLRLHGGADVSLDGDVLRVLLDHDWPGNARELENEVRRLLALGGAAIRASDLSPRLLHREAGAAPRPSVASLGTAMTLKQATRELEEHLAREALRACRGSVTEAAERLGLSRVGLHKLMKRIGLARKDVS
jgi:transcriptional regulator with PAS, ATPase and Fis domain